MIGDKAKIETKGFSFEDHPFVYRVYQQNVWGAKLIETPKSPKDVSKEFIDFKFLNKLLFLLKTILSSVL